MGIVWVTGLSGTGKSTVCAALRELGHRAFDADGDGFSRWVSRETGEPVDDPPYPVPAGWLDDYGWEIDVERVRAVAGTRIQTFLCGGAENESDVWDLFDRAVRLVLDDAATEARLASRSSNAFGKHPEELAAVLQWNRIVVDKYRRLGVPVVDARTARAARAPIDQIAGGAAAGHPAIARTRNGAARLPRHVSQLCTGAPSVGTGTRGTAVPMRVRS